MSNPRNKRGPGNPAYKLAQGMHTNTLSLDGSQNQSSGFAVPASHHTTQSTPSHPPHGTQRVGLLPHPGFAPPPRPLMMQPPGGLPPPSQFPQGPPPPLPQPGELGMTSLTDITTTVSSLGFPASCNFVLGLLQSYFTTSLASTETKSKPPSQLTRDNLHTLVDMFILCQPKTSFPEGMAPSLPPLNEVQLLLSIHGQLEDQQSMELHYCIFNAIFGDLLMQTGSSSNGRLDILKKLVSFAVSTESPNILACTSLWMRAHPAESASLVRGLYHEFVELLPNAHGPLLEVPSTSPHFAQELALTFTSLHPFHCVATKGSFADTSQPNPPIKLLQIITHWLVTYPDLLSSPPLLNKPLTDLPLIHSQSTVPHSDSKPTLQQLLPGLMQWAILSPLYCEPKPADLNKDTSKSKSHDSSSNSLTDQQKSLNELRLDSLSLGTSEDTKNVEVDTQSATTLLHAELLSGVLSLTKPLPCQLTGDQITVLIANLLGYYSVRKQAGGGQLVEMMDECVERLAQLLQISLSSGLLNLRPDDISSLASTLPKNRLLQLVITHAQKT